MTSGSLKSALRDAVIAALALLPCLAVAADWDLHALMSELGARTEGHARFVEKKYLAMLERPLEQRGELSYAPGRLEKVTESPKHERVVIDGDRLDIERADGKSRRLRLQDYPVLWGFVESVRATLTGNLAALQRFYAVRLDGPREDWRLTLLPRVQAMRAVVERIEIGGADTHIERIEVFEAQGDRSVMRVYEDSP